MNFLDFVKLLAPFTSRASLEDKLNFLFMVYDVDGDGEFLLGGGGGWKWFGRWYRGRMFVEV